MKKPSHEEALPRPEDGAICQTNAADESQPATLTEQLRRHEEKVRLARQKEIEARLEIENLFFAISEGWFLPGTEKSEAEIIREATGNSTPETVAAQARENKNS